MKSTIILLLMCGISVSQTGDAGETLSLEVNLQPQKFNAGERLYLEYIFKNTGTNAVYILSTPGHYYFYIKDYISNNIIMPNARLYSGPEIPKKDSFILLSPSESYTHRHDEPFILNESTNGNYRLRFYDDWCPVNTSGFIIKGCFIVSDYPMHELYDLDEFKGLDQSVPLFKSPRELVDETGYVYDGEYFRRKEVRSNKAEGEYTPPYFNHREVKCTRFEREEDLLTFEMDMVRIDVEKGDLANSLRDIIKSHDYVTEICRDKDMALLDHLKKMQGAIKLDCLDNVDRVKDLLSDLLGEGKCQIYDLSEQEYIQSFITAEWDTIRSSGEVFMFENNNIVFFENLRSITLR